MFDGFKIVQKFRVRKLSEWLASREKIRTKKRYEHLKEVREQTKRSAHPGRRVGKPHGSYVDDLVALEKSVILCWRCEHKFKRTAKSKQYRKQVRYPFIRGNCDACRNWCEQAQIYLLESYVNDMFLPEDMEYQQRRNSARFD